MSWQLYFHHSLHALLKSCSLQSLGTVLVDTPPELAQELLLLNFPSPKPGAQLLHKTRSLSCQEVLSRIFFPWARSLGISISMCLLPGSAGVNDYSGWGNPASHSCPAQAGVPGQWWHVPRSIPSAGSQTWHAKAVTDWGTASAVPRAAAKPPVCFMSESHLILQAFKARCADMAQCALQPLCSLWPARCARLQPEESLHPATGCGHSGVCTVSLPGTKGR